MTGRGDGASPSGPVLFPFAALVGQEAMRLALAVNAVDPMVGGVLIQGERGTAKSTAVRALSEVLPEQDVVPGCPYRCDPAEPWPDCPHCTSGEGGRDLARVRPPVVELPLGADEERVLGHLDLEAAIGRGEVRFHPGLLARAHRGILYVDEVNLLPDHLVDVLLDVAASGVHAVEREGFSIRHPSRFILVGTMNPEEGELRPQLLDRFGLSVAVGGLDDPAVRAEAVRRRLEFDADAEGFRARWRAAQEEIRARIESARTLLPEVRVEDATITAVAERCAASGAQGLRADLVIVRAARALAALEGRRRILEADVERAAVMALFHRRPHEPVPTPPPPRPSPPSREHLPPPPSWGGEAGSSRVQAGSVQAGSKEETSAQDSDERQGGPAGSTGGEGGERIWGIAEAGDDLMPRRHPARRRRTAQGSGHGRHERFQGFVAGRRVRSTPWLTAGGRLRGVIAVWDTLWRGVASARREDGSRRPQVVRAEDVRVQVREGRARRLVVVLVDASGSMSAYRRMESVKGHVLALVEKAYRNRDRVAVVAFRGGGAEVVVPPTNSVALARGRLARLPAGGRTPLAEGLREVTRLMQQASLRQPGLVPALVVFTDGRANASQSGTGDTRRETTDAARTLARLDVEKVVVDTEDGYVRLGLAGRLAEEMRAALVRLPAMKAARVGR